MAKFIASFIMAVGAGIALAFGVIAFGLVMAIPVFLAWNYVVPDVFGLPSITLVQAWCLIIVSGGLVRGRSVCNCNKDEKDEKD